MRAFLLVMVIVAVARPVFAAEPKDLLKVKSAYERAADGSEPARQRYILKLVKLAKDFADTGEWEAFQAVRAEMLAHPASSSHVSSTNRAQVAGPWEFPRRDMFFRTDGTFATHAGTPGKWQVSGNQFTQIGGVDPYERDGSRVRADSLKFTIILLNDHYLVLANDQMLHVGERLREPKALVAANAAFAAAGESGDSARARYAEELIRLREKDEDNQWQYDANLICLHANTVTGQDLADRLPGAWVGAGRLLVYEPDRTCKDESTGQRGTWRIENDRLVREMRDEEGFMHPVSSRVIVLTRHRLITTDEKQVFAETRKSP